MATNYSDSNFWRLDALQAPVFACNRPCLAIAGPGSGKTRTIIAKAARLIREHGDDLSSVALVTFTKAAANEMEHRLRLALPKLFVARGVKPLFIGTFHGLSLRLLRNYWAGAGIQRKILSDQESFDLLMQSIKEANSKLPYEDVQRAVARYKSMPSDHPFSEEETETDAWQVFSIYEKRRVANSACDLNDMVRECLAGLRAGTIQPLPVRHMMADEMQDADMVQLDWLLAHYSAGVIPTLVADDDQSIFAFRNAAGFRGLKMFAEATGAVVFPMTLNYRSCTSIVEAANLIIGDSPDRFAKDIQPHRNEEGSIVLQLHSSDGVQDAESVQSATVVASAQAWLEAHKGASAAVIARTNVELDTIELACKVHQVPFLRIGESDFMKRPHVVRAVLALTLPAKPYDHVAFSTACFVSGNIAAAARESILEFFHRSDGSEHVLDLASSSSLMASMRRDDQTAFRTFRQWITEWFDAFVGSDSEVSAAIVQLLGRLASECKESHVAKDLQFLGMMLSQWCKGDPISRISLLNKRGVQAKDKVGAITLCTAHASKGLEFDHVTIINASSHYWPHDKSEQAAPEEKRLFYVAATRAKDHLCVSMCSAEKHTLTEFMDPVVTAAMRTQQAADLATPEAGGVVNA